jgi:hypothetical protein
MLPSQTLHPFSPSRRLRARPQRHLTIVWPPSFKEITTPGGRHSRWIFQRHLQLKCPKLRVGRPSRWEARHQTSQPSRVLCEKQSPHKLIISCLIPSCRCEIYGLSIYLFFPFPQIGLISCSLIASISACHPERCLPVAGRFITVLIGIVSIPNSMAYYFLV